MQSNIEAELRNLRELARRSGVQTSFRDAFGQSRKATPEALMAVLRALGLDLPSPGAAASTLMAQERERWDWHVEPVLMAWDGGPSHLDVRVPRDAAGRVSCALTLESGEAYEWREELDTLPVHRHKTVGDSEYVARRLRVRAVPLGYHKLDVSSGPLHAKVTVIAAPSQTYSPGNDDRVWGIFAPLYALHSAESWGAGNYSDLNRFAAWLHSRGGRLVSTLPLTPSFLDRPYVPSPYSPVSRLFWNELYIDARRAVSEAGCPGALELLLSSETRKEIQRLRASATVDYRGQMSLTRRLVQHLAACAAGTVQAGAVDAYVASRPEVADYARFRAVHERRARPWPEWPDELKRGRVDGSGYDAAAYRYYVHAQWLAETQLASAAQAIKDRGQQIYLDLPTGSHGWGYDTWRYQDAFAGGITCGAPPDLLFTSGQDWGFPPLDPRAARRSGYEYLAAVLRHQMKYADILRIDHVMGLHRLFWIPEGSGAAEGVYVRYPAEENYAVLSLESHRNRVVVAGENLGTVPDYVNRALARRGVFETYVLQYEVPWREGGGLREPPARSVASLNTHDMPPFAGFLHGGDIGLRRNLGMITDEWVQAEGHGREAQRSNLVRSMREKGLLQDAAGAPELLRAGIEHLARSPARYVLVNLEDLWLETEPQNIPGSPESAPELGHI